LTRIRSILARGALLFGLLALLGACVGPAEPIWATDEEVARARYVDDGPPTLTLMTVVSNRTGGGAHTALLINADERIIFDPAGSWYHPQLPERNDVHYGMSDQIVDFYVDYHTRVTYHTIIQTVQVTPAQAAAAKRAAEAYGAVPKGQCAISTGRILRQVPGFENMPVGFFPNVLQRAFAKVPGVETRIERDFDSDDNSGMIQAPPALYLTQNR